MKPLKTQGFAQRLYEQSSTKRETLGRLRFTDDGRAFRYAKAGAAISAGYVCQGPEGVAEHTAEVNTGYTMAAGATNVTLLVGAVAITANMYDDGYLQIYDGAATAVGQNLQISSHGVISSAGGACNFTLKDPIIKACIATDTYSLVKNPWSSVIASAALANSFAGVSPIAVTSGYYFWIQTGGVACALNKSNTALGSVICLSTTAGAYITGSDYTSLLAGTSISYASVGDKYNPVYLTQF
jgi:hypothetical protein